jgi:hypothetical protein
MRLLHVHSGNRYGGVETLMRTLARCRELCAEMRPEFALCFEGRIADELRAQQVAVHMVGEVRARNPLQVLRARRRLVTILRNGRFDAVVCHMLWPLAMFAPAIRQAEVRPIFWMHDVAGGRNWLQAWASRNAARPGALQQCFHSFDLGSSVSHSAAKSSTIRLRLSSSSNSTRLTMVLCFALKH